MKIYTIVVCIGIFVTKVIAADNIVRPIRCPITTSDLVCKNNQHPGQVIDDNGCLVWECVPNQPYCCPQTTINDIKCTDGSNPVEVTDPQTGCLILACVQPPCCPRLSFESIFCEKASPTLFLGRDGCAYWGCTTSQ